MKKWIILFKEAISEFLTDNCPHLAAAISYYLLLSFFPLMLALSSITGFILRSPTLEAQVIDFVTKQLPPSSGEFVASVIRSSVGSRGALGIVSILWLLWSSSPVFSALRKALNTAWGIREPRPFFVERFMEIGMVVGAGLLVLFSVGLTIALSIVKNSSSPVYLGNLSLGGFFWQSITIVLGTAIAFIVFLLFYKIVPNTETRWKDIWPGALAAAIAFEVTKNIFVWYVTNFPHYTFIYGSLGGLIALLVWIYISAVIFLFCAKITSLYQRLMPEFATNPEKMKIFPHEKLRTTIFKLIKSLVVKERKGGDDVRKI
jgi:membrane protein